MFMTTNGFGGGFPYQEEAGTDGAAAGGTAAPHIGESTTPPQPAQPAPVSNEAPAPTQPQGGEEKTSQEASQEAPQPIQYEQTGDAALDYVLGYIGELGISPEHPAMQAAMNGEFDLLGVELAKSDARGAENILALAQKSYENFAEQAKAASSKTAETVLSIVGGEEQWQEISSWAAANATDEEKAAINGLFEQGGFAADIAATYLLNKFRGGSDVQYEGKPAATTAAPAPAPASGAPISRAEFAQEANRLYKQHGDQYSSTPEYKALARRVRR